MMVHDTRGMLWDRPITVARWGSLQRKAVQGGVPCGKLKRLDARRLGIAEANLVSVHLSCNAPKVAQ